MNCPNCGARMMGLAKMNKDTSTTFRCSKNENKKCADVHINMNHKSRNKSGKVHWTKK